VGTINRALKPAVPDRTLDAMDAEEELRNNVPNGTEPDELLFEQQPAPYQYRGSAATKDKAVATNLLCFVSLFTSFHKSLAILAAR
jgi:hypothetical protein